MKRQVEIFTANCPVCDPTVKLIKELACEQCQITIYDTVKQCNDKTCITKIKEYGLQRLPAVVVNGRLLSCCEGQPVTREALIAAGVGQSE